MSCRRHLQGEKGRKKERQKERKAERKKERKKETDRQTEEKDVGRGKGREGGTDGDRWIGGYAPIELYTYVHSDIPLSYMCSIILILY